MKKYKIIRKKIKHNLALSLIERACVKTQDAHVKPIGSILKLVYTQKYISSHWLNHILERWVRMIGRFDESKWKNKFRGDFGVISSP